ncbi:hypothetical protein [Pectinatus frisingensis]|uniref:hypothetical protein n=1 Tax=Pectinatus frisingensis TaxID=865 RepID=UPI0018C76D0B|nr:hypothetical protein [Pectinatus frisingensis]
MEKLGLSADELVNLIVKTSENLSSKEKIKEICESVDTNSIPGKEDIKSVIDVMIYFTHTALPTIIGKVVNENNKVISQQIEELLSNLNH